MVAVGLASGKVMLAALRIVIGATFIYAGLAKIGAEEAFADSVASFHLLPSVLNNVFTLGLPPFEILLGILLVVGRWRRMAAFCAVLTSGVFLLALVSAVLRGLPVDCGCFGPVSDARLPKHPLWFAVGRDVVLLAATAILYVNACKSSRNAAVSRTNASTETAARFAATILLSCLLVWLQR